MFRLEVIPAEIPRQERTWKVRALVDLKRPKLDSARFEPVPEQV